jgi:hypothetical protein
MPVKASYLQSCINKKGNFIATREPDEDGNLYEDWHGTSTIKTRVASLMHKLGHTPEECIDALTHVAHIEPSQAMDYIKFSPYEKAFDKEELTTRLRNHVYGEEYENLRKAGKTQEAWAILRKRKGFED